MSVGYDGDSNPMEQRGFLKLTNAINSSPSVRFLALFAESRIILSNSISSRAILEASGRGAEGRGGVSSPSPSTSMATCTGAGATSGLLPPPRTPSWSDMLPEIIGAVLRRLPSAADRAGLRSVCRSWRAAALCYPPPLPPLPLILYPGFAFTSPFTDGAMATAAHHLPLLGTPLELEGNYGQCAGSFGDWLVCTRLYWCTPPCSWTGADGGCFLVNPFSSEMINLPSPSAVHSCGTIQSSVPLCNGNDEVMCTIHAPEYAMALCKVVLSAPPDAGPSFFAEVNLGSSCIVAAISQKKGEYKLAFCRPGMQSWCICEGNCIKRYIDIEFYQGKLYVVDTSKGDLFAFEFEARDCFFPVVSRAEHCLIEQLPLIDGSDRQNCNLVQSHGKLLLVVRYFTGSWDQFTGVRVFALDFNSNPWRWIEMKGLDGESILISSSCSKSIPASEYDEIEDEHIYFLDHFCPNFFPKVLDNYSYLSQVYSIRDGKINPFLIGSRPMFGCSGFPMWFCPQ